MRKFKAPRDTSGITTSIGNRYPVEDGHVSIPDDAHPADELSLRSAGFVEVASEAPSEQVSHEPEPKPDEAEATAEKARKA